MNAPGKQAGLEMAEQFHELIEHADPRATGVDETRHALIDADGVGIGEAQRPIGVDMDVHPAGAQIVAGHIDDLGAGRGFARTDMLDLATRNMNVRDLVDSLLGVQNVRALQDEGIGRGIHADTPCE